MCEFDKLDKAFASDLYLTYKRSPSARVCISDKDQLLMFYLSLISLIIHEEKTKEISGMTVVVYLIQNSANLHKL